MCFVGPQLRQVGDVAKAEEIEGLLRQYPDAEEEASSVPAAPVVEDKAPAAPPAEKGPANETSMVEEAMATIKEALPAQDYLLLW